jgi:hypothetical protein
LVAKRISEGEIVFVFVREGVALDSLQSAKLIVGGSWRSWRWQGRRESEISEVGDLDSLTTDVF